jgi:hypothetical protein
MSPGNVFYGRVRDSKRALVVLDRIKESRGRKIYENVPEQLGERQEVVVEDLEDAVYDRYTAQEDGEYVVYAQVGRRDSRLIILMILELEVRITVEEIVYLVFVRLHGNPYGRRSAWVLAEIDRSKGGRGECL